MIEVRRLTQADAEATWRLRREALEREPASFAESPEEVASVESFAERLGSGGDNTFMYGGLDGHQLVAMAGFFRETRVKRRHKGIVWGVYVSPPWRGQGAGRAVMNALLENARSLSELHHIYLSVTAAQSPARQLYISLGFRPFGLEPRSLAVDGRYFDEEHMLLELD